MFRPKISGIKGITQESVLHWSKSINSTNPRWPPNVILNYKKAFVENDRESSVLDSRHLQATFLKKSAFYNFFSISKSNAPGLCARVSLYLLRCRHMGVIMSSTSNTSCSTSCLRASKVSLSTNRSSNNRITITGPIWGESISDQWSDQKSYSIKFAVHL